MPFFFLSNFSFFQSPGGHYFVSPVKKIFLFLSKHLKNQDVLAIPVNEVAGTKLLYHVVQSR